MPVFDANQAGIYTKWLTKRYFVVRRRWTYGALIGGFLAASVALWFIYDALAKRATEAAEQKIAERLGVKSFDEVKKDIEFIQQEEAILRAGGTASRVQQLENLWKSDSRPTKSSMVLRGVNGDQASLWLIRINRANYEYVALLLVNSHAAVVVSDNKVPGPRYRVREVGQHEWNLILENVPEGTLFYTTFPAPSPAGPATTAPSP
jgi:hypothetical protein